MDTSVLKVDPDFQAQIPPLTEEEFAQLRENILADGQVYEPIIAWNGTILDGYHRWSIIQENWDVLKGRYSILNLDFPNRWAAFDWMYRKQFGRRNLSEEQRAYMIGRMYDARKLSAGGQVGNSNAQKRCGHGDHMDLPSERPIRTEEQIAAELGIGSRTVRRAAEFARGVDALKAVSPEAAAMILADQRDLPWEDVRAIPKLEPDAIEALADSIVSGAPIPRQMFQHRGRTRAEKKNYAKIEAIERDMYDRSTVPEYTVDCLTDDISLYADSFVQELRNTIKDRRSVITAENLAVVIQAIETTVIDECRKLIDEIRQNSPKM